MSVAWAINGEAAAALGVTEITRLRSAQNEDEVVLRCVVKDGLAAAALAFNADVGITRDGAPWFAGICKSIPRTLTADNEAITYRIVGAWYWLRAIYRQPWKAWTGAAVETVAKTRVVLCQDETGARIRSGAQIRHAVQVAIDAGAPIQIGTIDAGMELPWEQDRDLRCLEVVQRMLRYHPDWVAWFDYSTTPPTFHARQQAALTAKTLTVGTTLGGIESVTPRYDLQVPGVRIVFEKTHTTSGINGAGEGSFQSIEVQEAGDVEDIEAVHATVELDGQQSSYSSLRLVTEDIPAGDGTKGFGWWASRVDAIGKLLEADCFIPEVVRTNTAMNLETGEVFGAGDELPRIVLEPAGGLAPWLQAERGLEFCETVFSIELHQWLRKNGVRTGDVVTTPYSFKCVTTNGQTRWYNRRESMTGAEATPAGLAAALFAAWSALQYDGQLSTVDEEIPDDAIGPGCVLNIGGGLAAWGSMRALVQSVTENVFAGTRQIEIGPARRVSIDDVLGLLRRFRNRSAAFAAASRQTAKALDNAGQLEAAGPGPLAAVSSTPPEHNSLVVSKRDTEGAAVSQVRLVPDEMALYNVLAVEDVSGVPTARFGWARFHA